MQAPNESPAVVGTTVEWTDSLEALILEVSWLNLPVTK